MKRFLIVLFLIAAGIIAFGFYRGWFGATSTTVDNKTHFDLTVDKDKIHEDEKNAADRIHRLGHPNDKATAPTEKRD